MGRARAEHGAPLRRGHQGARHSGRAPQRLRSVQHGSRGKRSDQGAWRGREAMGERAWQARRGAERALQGLCRALGTLGAPLPRRRGCEAGDRAGAWRQSLQGPGLVEHPILRFLEAGLSPHRPLGRGRHPQYRGRRRQDAKARAVLSRADACGLLAVELRLHQPRSGARHALHQRGQFGARHGASCARPRALQGSVAHQPDRSRRHSRSAGIWR